MVGLIATDIVVGTPAFTNKRFNIERLDRRGLDEGTGCSINAHRGIAVFVRKGLDFERLLPTHPLVPETLDYLLVLVKDGKKKMLACALYIPPSTYVKRPGRLRREFRRLVTSLRCLKKKHKCQVVLYGDFNFGRTRPSKVSTCFL